jgi:hypothetical protein
MNSFQAHPHAVRFLLATLAAIALLAAMSAVAAEAPITSDQFTPGWEQDARPLFFMGPTRDARDKYRVSPLLPHGDYVVVSRKGAKDSPAELVRGYRFTVPRGNVDQYLFLPSGLGSVDAVPVADVPALQRRATDSSGLR